MGSDRFITADGCSLFYDDVGTGCAVVWQHGLCADREQPREVFPERLNVRRITLECRAHGASDMGQPTQLTIAEFTNDVVALLDHLDIKSAVVGGISLGAAIGIRIAARFPSRVRALILARPAWVGEPAPVTLNPYLLVSQLLKQFGREEGLRRFEQSSLIAEVDSISPDNGSSLRSLFSRQRVESTIELLSRIPKDGPGLSRAEISALSVPTIVIASNEDYVHPLRYAAELRDLIPGATLTTITSKSVDKNLHKGEFSAVLAAFLQKRTVVG